MDPCCSSCPAHSCCIGLELVVLETVTPPDDLLAAIKTIFCAVSVNVCDLKMNVIHKNKVEFGIFVCSTAMMLQNLTYFTQLMEQDNNIHASCLLQDVTSIPGISCLPLSCEYITLYSDCNYSQYNQYHNGD